MFFYWKCQALKVNLFGNEKPFSKKDEQNKKVCKDIMKSHEFDISLNPDHIGFAVGYLSDNPVCCVVWSTFPTDSNVPTSTNDMANKLNQRGFRDQKFINCIQSKSGEEADPVDSEGQEQQLVDIFTKDVNSKLQNEKVKYINNAGEEKETYRKLVSTDFVDVLEDGKVSGQSDKLKGCLQVFQQYWGPGHEISYEKSYAIVSHDNEVVACSQTDMRWELPVKMLDIDYIAASPTGQGFGAFCLWKLEENLRKKAFKVIMSLLVSVADDDPEKTAAAKRFYESNGFVEMKDYARGKSMEDLEHIWTQWQLQLWENNPGYMVKEVN